MVLARDHDLPYSAAYERFSYDPETGIFTNKTSGQNRKAGQRAGVIVPGKYVALTINSRQYRAHRIAWLLMTGSMPEHQIDHIDRDKHNNRWSNLREATSSQNLQNIPMLVTNTSGFVGISKTQSGRWKAQIRHDGTRDYLGTFDTKEEASDAYEEARKRLHPFRVEMGDYSPIEAVRK